MGTFLRVTLIAQGQTQRLTLLTSSLYGFSFALGQSRCLGGVYNDVHVLMCAFIYTPPIYIYKTCEVCFTCVNHQPPTIYPNGSLCLCPRSASKCCSTTGGESEKLCEKRNGLCRVPVGMEGKESCKWCTSVSTAAKGPHVPGTKGQVAARGLCVRGISEVKMLPTAFSVSHPQPNTSAYRSCQLSHTSYCLMVASKYYLHVFKQQYLLDSNMTQ